MRVVELITTIKMLLTTSSYDLPSLVNLGVMLHNPYSVISDLGTLQAVRVADNLSLDMKLGFDQFDMKIARLKHLEAKRRKEVLKESVRTIQQAANDPMKKSDYAKALSRYEPPILPVASDSEAEFRDVAELLVQMESVAFADEGSFERRLAKFESLKTKKKKLVDAHGEEIEEESEEQIAKRARMMSLLQALQMDASQLNLSSSRQLADDFKETDATIGDVQLMEEIERLLSNDCEIPLPRESVESFSPPSRLKEARESSDSTSSSDDIDRNRHRTSRLSHHSVVDDEARLVFDFLSHRRGAASKVKSRRR